MSDVKAETRIARVVHVVDSDLACSPLHVVVNQGARHGVEVGGRFLVFGTSPHIADPDTGIDLGALELVRSQGEVVQVRDRTATIRSTERRRTRPAKRLIRDSATRTALGIIPDPDGGTALTYGAVPSTSLVEAELSTETGAPFDSVQLGDLAKRI